MLQKIVVFLSITNNIYNNYVYMAKIKSLQSYEILASNGLPTIEVRIELENGIVEFSSISYGASAGSREAMQLVDKSDSRFKGNGMLQAISNINEIIVPKIIGRECEFLEIDKLLLELDPTFDKSKLGGNAILSVSQAICKTQAKSEKEIYELISDFMQIYVEYLPMPNMVMIEGGKHADNSTDLQEYALAYQNDTVNYLDQIRILEEIYLEVKKELKNEITIQMSETKVHSHQVKLLATLNPWKFLKLLLQMPDIALMM